MWPSHSLDSGGLGRGLPLPASLRSQGAKSGARDRVGLRVEDFVDGGVWRDEPLGGALGLELLLLSLSNTTVQSLAG